MFTPFAFVKTAAAAGPPAFDYVLGYTSSFVAYSVARKLSSTYTGSALRVRRSSDNTEQDIGFSNNILDTSALNSFVGANSGHIVTLYDQSGNSANLTGEGSGGGPKIINAGTLITSSAGIPAFATSEASGHFFSRNTTFTSAAVVEVFSTLTLTGYTGNDISWSTPDNGYAAGSYQLGSGKFSIIKSSGAQQATQTPGTGNPLIIDVFYNIDGGTNASFLWINDNVTTTTFVTGDFNASTFNKINLGTYSGPGFISSMNCSEWIMFNNTNTQRSNIRTNFDNFYNTY